MKSLVLKLALAATALSFSAAQAAVIDFEADATGAKPNGFSAVGHPGVTFTDTVGTDLSVNNFGSQSGGTKGLAVFDDFDRSSLQINFATRQTTISLDFGNDDRSFTGEDVFALLQLFDGATLVSATLLATNNNDVMDQTIAGSFAGGFDRAVFTYVGAGGNPLGRGLIEIVDNINYNQVPEPASLALLTLGLIGLGFNNRRRTK